MNFISQLLLALIFASPAAAHHGPYSKNTDGSTHELHLGKVQTLSPRGQVVLYGVRAVSLSELIFDKPWFGCGLMSCGEPFALPTSQIIREGLDNPGFCSDLRMRLMSLSSRPFHSRQLFRPSLALDPHHLTLSLTLLAKPSQQVQPQFLHPCC